MNDGAATQRTDLLKCDDMLQYVAKSTDTETTNEIHTAKKLGFKKFKRFCFQRVAILKI